MTTKKPNKGVLLHLKDPTQRQADDAAEEQPPTRSKDSLPEVAHVILGYVAMYPGGVHGYQLGRTLSEPLVDTNQTPDLALAMIRVGESTGALP